MSTWAPGTIVRDNGFGGSRGGASVIGAIVHHTASRDALDYVANANSRDSHPTYYVRSDGAAFGIVHPDRRPFSTANGVDAFSITFEVENSGIGGDWPVTDAAAATVARIIKHHADESPRRGRPVEVNDPARTQAGFFVGWHSQYVATGCPGPNLLSRIPAIVDASNSGVAPAPTPGGGGGTGSPSGLIAEDGVLGPETIGKLQRALAGKGYYSGNIDGVIDDGDSLTVRGLQRYLNDADHAGLVVDGAGFWQSGPPATYTNAAVQRHVGAPVVDGYFDVPVSNGIRLLQAQLNAGKF